MRNNAEILKYVNLIRAGARAVVRPPFAASAIVEACLTVELAGMPRNYRLPATAQEYAAVFHSSEQMAVSLAGRVGNPRVSPVPPLWPVLALLLLGWRETISAERVLEQAAEVRAEEDVQRGLAIVAYLFPELQGWLRGISLKIPRWERSLAVPLAARKLVRLEMMNSAVSAEQSVRAIPWRATGGSRRGASHLRSVLKNQDAIKHLVSADGSSVVLAVADGHGSDLCFRSDAGSRLAVEKAVDLLCQFATISRNESGPAIAERARTVLAEELTQSWHTAVQCHLDTRPITQSEWARLAAVEGWKGQHVINRHPELAYGTTILAVLATERYVLCMQLGDGDILFVDLQGYTRRVLPKHDQSRARQTASLYRRNASSKFRVHVQHATEDLPALILAATDGYANSYETDDEFLEVGREYLKMLGTEGFDGVEKRITCLLDESSPEGYGDDTTIGFISRFDRQEMAALKEEIAHFSPTKLRVAAR